MTNDRDERERVFRVPRDGRPHTLDILLSPKRDAATPAGTGTPTAPGPAYGPLSGFIPEDDFIPPQRVALTFYDLSTRLVSSPPGTNFADVLRRYAIGLSAAAEDGHVNEYLELVTGYELRETNVDRSESGLADGLMAHLEDEARDRYTAQMTGQMTGDLDPFGSTPANGSGRLVPNCQPLPWNAEQHLVAVRAGGRKYIAGVGDPVAHPPAEPDADVATEDTWAKSARSRDADAAESWAAYTSCNDHEGKEAGMLRITAAGGGLRLVCENRYYSWDTEDARFKVTSEPQFAADRVPFSLTAGEYRVYLMPRVQDSGLSALTDWSFNDFIFMGESVARYGPIVLAAHLPAYPHKPFPLRRRTTYNELSNVKTETYLKLNAAGMAAVVAGAARYFPKVITDSFLGRYVPKKYAEFGQVPGGPGPMFLQYAPPSLYAPTLHYFDLGRLPPGIEDIPSMNFRGLLLGVVAQGERRWYVWADVNAGAELYNSWATDGDDAVLSHNYYGRTGDLPGFYMRRNR